jgi:mono/diheme cytochrome c family protein
MHRCCFVAVVVCTVLVAGVEAQNPGGSPEGKALKNPVPSSPASITAGQQRYQKMCAFCHGKDAQGNGPMAPKGTSPSSLVDDKWERGSTDGEIFLVLRDGAGPKFDMKGFKDRIPERELWNIVNYLRSLAPGGSR